MGIAKYLFILVGLIFIPFIYSKKVLAIDATCVECSVHKSKILEGDPEGKAIKDLVASTAKPVILAGAAANGDETSSKEDYQMHFCMKYEMAEDKVDVKTIFKDMEKSPYSSSLNEFWTTPACHAPLKNDTKVPIIFNTASNPVKNELFPKVVYDYFVGKKKDSNTWLATINTKTSDGLTFLDFLNYNIQRGFYSVAKDREAALRIVNYICMNGGVYSKYKDSAKCP